MGLGRRSCAIAARIALTVLLVFALSPRTARAAKDDDASLSAQADKVLQNDFANANYGDARKKLKSLLDRCKRAQCTGSTVAQIHVGLGMISAQINQTEEAKNSFVDALNADENATLPSTGVTPPIKAAWGEAQKAWLAAHPQPDDATKAGWTSKQAFDLARAAQAAEAAGNYAECIDKDKGALILEEQPRARLHLSSCEAHANKVIDGLRDAQRALEGAAKTKDDSVAKAAQKRLEELLPRVAHIGFEVPGGVQDFRITFDEKPVPNDKLGQKFSVDPGKHHAHAEGNVSGAVLTFDGDVELKDGETQSVKITLKPTALTPGQLSCMLSAKTQEEILKCLPQNQKTLVVRAGMDVGAYTDTTHVHVLTPSINAAISSPTAGWNVGGSYVIDVVTAASPDIVSSASSHFRDVRHAAAITGGYKPKRFGAQASAFLSTEHDYLSRGAGLTVNGDFFDKQVTPQIGFTHSQDTIGRTGTPFSVFSNSLSTEEFQAGTTIVASRTSIIVVGGSMSLERGDQSKPYRFVPMFAPGDNVPVGASIGSVNATRLPVRPLEQLPLDRDRYALAGRYALRLGNATLRLEERVYTDTWNIHATTTDARYIIDVSRKLRVWPHLHLHLQTPASFYQRVYTASLNSDGSTDIPKWRTDDRELSPLASLTLGGGMRYAFSAPGAKIQYGISLQGDAMGTKYFNALFIKYRLAGYGTLGFDVEFE